MPSDSKSNRKVSIASLTSANAQERSESNGADNIQSTEELVVML